MGGARLLRCDVLCVTAALRKLRAKSDVFFLLFFFLHVFNIPESEVYGNYDELTF